MPLQLSVIAPGARPDAALRAAVRRLLIELDPKNPPLPDNLDALLRDPSARLIIAAANVEDGQWPTDPDQCVGMLTLTIRNSLTRRSAQLDHVVVEPAYRKTGIGRRLVEEALRLAATAGASRVDLTSSPHRVAAHGLYRALKFEKRQTSNWRRNV